MNQELDILNRFEENGGLFTARKSHYELAQNFLKAEKGTEEQIKAAQYICMSFSTQSKFIQIDIDMVKLITE